MGRGPLGDGLFELTGPVGQLRVRPAQRFLAFLALGDVPDVALNVFSSVFIVQLLTNSTSHCLPVLAFSGKSS